MTATPATPRPDLNDIIPFAAFVRECERSKLATKSSLQWWMRYRHTNGLTTSGVVLEKFPNPRSKRPMLFVVRPRFIDWMLSGQMQEAA